MSDNITSLVEDYKKGRIEDPIEFKQKLRAEVSKHDTTIYAGKGKTHERELSPADTSKAVELATMFQLGYRAKMGDLSALKQIQRVEGARKSVLVEGDNSLGGYLVDDEFHRVFVEFFKGNSALLDLCRTIPMNADKMLVPTGDTKLSVHWSSESDSITQSNPTFGQKTLDSTRLNTYATVSNELLADSELQLQTILLDQFGEAVGQALDNEILNADGSGSTAFSGVFTAAAGYSEVFDTGSTAFSEVLTSHFLNLSTKVPAYVRNERNSAYVLHPDVWKYIQLEMDDNGQYRQDPFNALRNPQIWGHRVVFAHEAPSPDDSAADTPFIAFGNWNYMGVGIRNRSYFLVDPYSNSLTNQTNFVMVHRYAFAILKAAAFARMITAA